MPETAPAASPRPAPDPLPWPKPGILVGIDGSDASRAALRYAADLAPKLGLPLHALRVWDYPALQFGADGTYDAGSLADGVDELADLAGRELVRVFSASVPEWATSGERRGRPAQGLVDASGEAALLVVGAQGHSTLAGALLGSVSDSCVAHAQCPVLVVRAEYPDD